MIKTILQVFSGAIYHIDDILVNVGSDREHLKVLNIVLERLKLHGLLLRKSKCLFLHNSVEYLGH